jgi:hypothetical protein
MVLILPLITHTYCLRAPLVDGGIYNCVYSDAPKGVLAEGKIKRKKLEARMKQAPERKEEIKENFKLLMRKRESIEKTLTKLDTVMEEFSFEDD